MVSGIQAAILFFSCAGDEQRMDLKLTKGYCLKKYISTNRVEPFVSMTMPSIPLWRGLTILVWWLLRQTNFVLGQVKLFNFAGSIVKQFSFEKMYVAADGYTTLSNKNYATDIHRGKICRVFSRKFEQWLLQLFLLQPFKP